MSAASPREKLAESAGFWAGELGYRQATLVLVTSALLGGFLQATAGARAVGVWLMWPAGVAIVACALGARLCAKSRLVAWLGGVEMAVTSIAAVALIALVGAVVPQSQIEKRLGASLWSSWLFLLPMSWLSACLATVTSKRIWPLNWRNFCFTLSHLGLLIAILGGAWSSLGLQRLRIMAVQSQDTSSAEQMDGGRVRLPFSVRLRSFELKTFPPTLAIATMDKTASEGYRLQPLAGFVKAGTQVTSDAESIKVLKFFPQAANVGGVWHPVAMKSAAPAAYVEVLSKKGELNRGWVSCGSSVTPGDLVALGNTRALVMTPPRPRSFQSLITLKEGGRLREARVEVNEPISVGAYRLYQLSYDEQAGADSAYSILEIVKDRGLPVVYTGVFLMLGGALLMIWNGVVPPEKAVAASAAGVQERAL
ncbi:MAG: cytochrome c biogenesis protein ResB [Armatimonadetes bacterium]|nr:cytochrome c biogenesis protein ResB [Armatimonadota bacterium]